MNSMLLTQSDIQKLISMQDVIDIGITMRIIAKQT